MKRIKSTSLVIFTVLLLSSCGSSNNSSFTNMVAIMEVKEPIEGVCNNDYVIAILPFPGSNQVEAKAPRTNEEITKELNSRVEFLKGKADYEDKGSVNLIVNCKGEMVRCEIGNESQSPELDKQIVAIFNEMKLWKAGTLNGKSVDTAVIYSFIISKGLISIN